jgi:hypothetical protein
VSQHVCTCGAGLGLIPGSSVEVCGALFAGMSWRQRKCFVLWACKLAGCRPGRCQQVSGCNSSAPAITDEALHAVLSASTCDVCDSGNLALPQGPMCATVASGREAVFWLFSFQAVCGVCKPH